MIVISYLIRLLRTYNPISFLFTSFIKPFVHRIRSQVQRVIQSWYQSYIQPHIKFMIHMILAFILFFICFSLIFSTGMITSTSVIYYLFFYSFQPLLYHHYPLHFATTTTTTHASTRPLLYATVPIRPFDAKEEKFFLSKKYETSTRIQQVDLELSFPENDIMIQHVGMFTVKMLLLEAYDRPIHPASTESMAPYVYNNNKYYKILFSSHTNCMLQYRSQLLRWMDAIVYSPLYLLNLKRQEQKKRLKMLIEDDTTLVQQFNHIIHDMRRRSYEMSKQKDSFSTNYDKMMIRIEVSDDRVQLYSAHIHFNAHVIGWRYYTYHYKWILWVILIPILVLNHSIIAFFTSIFIVAYVFMNFVWRRSKPTKTAITAKPTGRITPKPTTPATKIEKPKEREEVKSKSRRRSTVQQGSTVAISEEQAQSSRATTTAKEAKVPKLEETYAEALIKGTRTIDISEMKPDASNPTAPIMKEEAEERIDDFDALDEVEQSHQLLAQEVSSSSSSTTLRKRLVHVETTTKQDEL